MVVEYERTDNVATRCEVLGYVACSFVNGTCRVVSDTFGAIHINSDSSDSALSGQYELFTYPWLRDDDLLCSIVPFCLYRMTRITCYGIRSRSM